MGVRNTVRLHAKDKTITSADIRIFCTELQNAIKSVSLDGKTEEQIAGEIFTRTRSNIWYKIREDSYLGHLFRTNMKVVSRNAPLKLQAIVQHIIRKSLDKYAATDASDDVSLSIASMTSILNKMEDINKESAKLGSQLMHSLKTLNELENENV